jgi:UrcA family protein
MPKTLILSAVAVLGVAAASSASAAGQTWQVGRDAFHVRFEDLDLGTAIGRAQALARVETAAVRLCRANSLQSDRAACEAAIIAQASRGPAGETIRQALAERRERAWAMARPE